ncbi:MAG: TIGR02679 domain-containing protein [Eubacteriales bacterium]|nr:TIGR02679 domain-containing protein [Eubacteriales bacterium]
MLTSCVKYFKDNAAYKRIFAQMRKQWKKYGKTSGFILLEKATAAEREALRSLMGQSFDDETVKFRMSEFERALQETKYRGISLQELLETYFNETLVTNKNERRLKTEARRDFVASIRDELAAQNESKYANASRWIEKAVCEKKYGYGLMLAEYDKQGESIRGTISKVCEAIAFLQSIEKNKIRLAVLSAVITSNPHFFDRKNIAGKLLISALSFMNEQEYPQDAEGILELYYLSNIKPDDLSSYTTVYGINLYTEEGLHKSYETFIEKNEAYVVTLSNLNRIVKADCKSRQVFIFENQMVFSHMCESLAGMPVAMICTSGQMKTASLMLIDLLCKEGCVLYYSGDIDPEGIGIADRVIARDPEHIIPWRLDKEDYMLSISDEKLDGSRIKKLEKVRDHRLLGAVEALREKKRAAYQELLIDKMLVDIKEKTLC